MELIHSPVELQIRMLKARSEGKKIGFVPTMGALHDGHIALASQVRSDCDILVMSVFVNPLQFAANEDLDKYPRTLEADCGKASVVGVDIMFAPSPREMYPAGFDSNVSCGSITSRLEGAARPGHFDGVTTVVLKLFNLVQPNYAVFGQKDAQQVLVIKRMVADLSLPVEIVVAPIVRQNDGLALSSRNVYLTPAERSEAPYIFRGLNDALAFLRKEEVSAQLLKEYIESQYRKSSEFETEYVSITDFDCVEIVGGLPPEFLVSVVCRAKESRTRLIDNIIVK